MTEVELVNSISEQLEESQRKFDMLIQEIKDENAQWEKEMEEKRILDTLNSEFFQLIRINRDWRKEKEYEDSLRSDRGF